MVGTTVWAPKLLLYMYNGKSHAMRAQVVCSSYMTSYDCVCIYSYVHV